MPSLPRTQHATLPQQDVKGCRGQETGDEKLLRVPRAADDVLSGGVGNDCFSFLTAWGAGTKVHGVNLTRVKVRLLPRTAVLGCC